MDVKSLLLKNPLSPGDVLVMTAAVESLVSQFPGKYRISVETTCPEIWFNNPNVVQANAKCEAIQMHYPLINESHMLRSGHFMNGYCEYLGSKLGIPLKLQTNKPSIYLTEKEKNKVLVNGDYIVINSGVKSDYTCKGWGQSNYQEVVNKLKGKFKFVQIGESHHIHKPLEGTVNMIGKTSCRELFTLCNGASAGIGGVTFLQHIMAALSKPYVCLLGGREPLSWVWYPTQAVLSTQGQLACCTPNACWKSRVVPLGDGDSKDKCLCLLPVIKNDENIPKCMEMITPSEVVRELEKFVEGKIIHVKT